MTVIYRRPRAYGWRQANFRQLTHEGHALELILLTDTDLVSAYKFTTLFRVWLNAFKLAM